MKAKLLIILVYINIYCHRWKENSNVKPATFTSFPWIDLSKTWKAGDNLVNSADNFD